MRKLELRKVKWLAQFHTKSPDLVWATCPCPVMDGSSGRQIRSRKCTVCYNNIPLAYVQGITNGAMLVCGVIKQFSGWWSSRNSLRAMASIMCTWNNLSFPEWLLKPWEMRPQNLEKWSSNSQHLGVAFLRSVFQTGPRVSGQNYSGCLFKIHICGP